MADAKKRCNIFLQEETNNLIFREMKEGSGSSTQIKPLLENGNKLRTEKATKRYHTTITTAYLTSG
jgi:hypothetical protein